MSELEVTITKIIYLSFFSFYLYLSFLVFALSLHYFLLHTTPLISSHSMPFFSVYFLTPVQVACLSYILVWQVSLLPYDIYVQTNLAHLLFWLISVLDGAGIVSFLILSSPVLWYNLLQNFISIALILDLYFSVRVQHTQLYIGTSLIIFFTTSIAIISFIGNVIYNLIIPSKNVKPFSKYQNVYKIYEQSLLVKVITQEKQAWDTYR